MKPNNEEQGVLELITWRLQMIFFNLADAVIAPTQVIENTLVAQGIKTRTKVIASGINTKQFSCKTDFSLKNRILHLGRLGLEKSTDVVIKAFALVHKELPDMKLIIVGDGPARTSLQQLAEELGIKDSVEFTGMLDHAKAPEMYRSCDIFVTASTMETQGLVLLEAMLSGLSIIAVAVNAPVDLVKDGYNGYLFPENNTEKCAKSMLSILKDPNRIAMSKNARTFAESFGSELLSQELVSYYHEILKPTPRS
jgi:glycosyltransferase involved in cell wall biosynthesis